MGEFLTGLWAFMKERNKFWSLPILTVLLFLGTLIVLSRGSAVTPFMYTLFGRCRRIPSALFSPRSRPPAWHFSNLRVC